MAKGSCLVIACALLGCGEDAVTNLPDAPVPDSPVPNRAPAVTAAAGAAMQVSLVGRTVQLPATGTDEDGDTLTFAWTQLSGPTVTLADPTTATPSFLARSVGTYSFQVIANDGTVDSAPATLALDIWDIDGGEDFTLVLKPDGTLLSWGDNSTGALGDPLVVAERRVPGRVCDTDQTDCATNPFTGAIAISVGSQHALALKNDGSVWAWGDNGIGQLGNNDNTGLTVTTPHRVCNVGATDCTADPLVGVAHIAAGFLFSTALKTDGTVVAWGQNTFGQVGNGITSVEIVPNKVCAPGQTAPCTAFLDNVVQLAAGGGGHSLAIRGDGSLVAWGHNKAGQVGIGDSTVRTVTIPQEVCDVGAAAPCATFLTGVVAIDAWSGHSLALKSDGSLFAWGSDDESELGAVPLLTCSGGSLCTETPVPVCLTNDSPCTTPLTGVASFAAGRRFSMALKTDGSVLAWGDNVEGQQGDGTAGAPRVSPGPVCAVGDTAPCANSLGGVSVIAAGSFHALAIRNDSSFVLWGDNDFGQLGNNDANGTDALIPIAVTVP